MIKFVTHAAAGLLNLAGTAAAETTTPMGQTVMGSTTLGTSRSTTLKSRKCELRPDMLWSDVSHVPLPDHHRPRHQSAT